MGKMNKGKRGYKQPIGETKSQMLIYLAEYDRVKFNPLQEYFKNEYNVGKRSIRNHLDQFDSNGLVSKNSVTIGPDGVRPINEYRLKKDFDVFKEVYDYLKEYGYERQLLCTDYYQQLVDTDEFIAKLILNVFRDGLLKADQLGLLEKDDHAPIKDLTKRLEKNGIGWFYISLKERFEIENMPGISGDLVLYHVSSEYPPEKLKEFKKILKLSPSALNLLISPSYFYTGILFGVCSDYYGVDHAILKTVTSLMDNIQEYSYDREENGRRVDNIMDVSLFKLRHPLYNAARSMLTYDVFKGNINEYDDDLEDLYDLLGSIMWWWNDE